MSEVKVLFTRTYDGDYIADFSCNESDLPRTNTFGYSVISDDELASLRSAVAERDADYAGLRAMLKCPDDLDLASWIDTLLNERDAAIERMHKALLDVIEHQAELNTSYGRPISHSKTIALAIAGLNEDEAAAIRARNETKEE